ncbi:MAG: hypothetical protein ACRDFC_09915, partial [Ignavibacteria bacterium]
MKKLTFILAFNFTLLTFPVGMDTHNLFSQPSITWQRTYDSPCHVEDYGYDICPAPNGNFYVVGSTFCSTPFSHNILVFRINQNGDTIWTRNIGTSGGQEAFAAVSSDDGGCVLTGLWGGQAFTLKLNSVGDTSWVKFYGDSGIWSFDIKRTSDGGYI